VSLCVCFANTKQNTTKAKEENRVQFANQAAAFKRTAKESTDETSATHFGFTLAEVEAFGAVLKVWFVVVIIFVLFASKNNVVCRLVG
jgi:hypothetical protein